MQTTHPKFNHLIGLLNEIEDLSSAVSILHWDQSTYIPSQAMDNRSIQIATLEKTLHEKKTSQNLEKTLEDISKEIHHFDKDSDEAALYHLAKKKFDKATLIPSKFQEKFIQHHGNLYSQWIHARPDNNFKTIESELEKNLEMSLEYSSFFKEQEHPADPFIDESDPGMKASSIKVLFSNLRKDLVPLVQKITESQNIDDSCVRQVFNIEKQLHFSELCIKDIGYDYTRGRMDKTFHPFMTRFNTNDIRITTRVKENYFPECLFSCIHEAGHALYELGIDPKFDRLPLGHGVSSGIHESQSRLWENCVGRSLPFWKFYYPKLQEFFPKELSSVSLDSFYQSINKVTPSLIRTDADEVTYNLHVMIRFDLECQMLEGKLKIKDLPEAWNARYKSDLAITPDSDTNGVLQDVHWYFGPIGGAFQGYTIGNLFSAQCVEAARNAISGLDQKIESGNFKPLRDWLTQNLYQYGSKYTPEETLLKCTEKPLSHEAFLRYLNKKFLSKNLI